MRFRSLQGVYTPKVGTAQKFFADVRLVSIGFVSVGFVSVEEVSRTGGLRHQR